MDHPVIASLFVLSSIGTGLAMVFIALWLMPHRDFTTPAKIVAALSFLAQAVTYMGFGYTVLFYPGESVADLADRPWFLVAAVATFVTMWLGLIGRYLTAGTADIPGRDAPHT